MYEVTFSKKAIKVLKKFPKENQLRIKDGVDKLSIDPFKMDLEKIHTSDATHRLRIGAYRLFLQIDTSIKEIIVSTIKRRTTQTYR
ncbi:hypothetical protein A3B42_02000 [Candidatus Daviesbacteria bacterium RIFCSPLOWO2_01_FULL_38_10]|nr:MAG: hypothetical protein US80_C0015G0019 [Candidatus Daviesbacteria bacterium GW2011_GWA2_38_17]OGE38012.1 MAG: hypothetical protein A3B42_02000 [Candidatus Daviesbacteria bacterium RIFCSPLOWO2_01_FULL_38_10]OGE67190.1 MAG: hypothetical protein A3H81_04170 [Candidatus Daviesbacteria bacterium RIFCSPLOWO2_02_FULL_38_18]OGE73526.1 MAG: hypothetical protein A3H18_02905 [Candidatus Daviesbacteria bacterium RIFCSPLOWO2_12_FULL_38_10]HCB22969.1 hypothetical protein [Candidatus Daviesbacteria bact